MQKNTLTIALALLAALPAYSTSNVLVIDEGIDLSHPSLQPRAQVNLNEQNGASGTDDDNNGFVDDLAGWNSVSNDAEFFPSRVKSVFDENKDRISGLFAIYSRVEQGDRTAIPELQQDPMGMRILSSLLSASHGTHVGGIVAAQYQKQVPFLQSFNVFTPSKEDQEPQSLIAPSSNARVSSKITRAFMKRFATILLNENGDTTVTTTNDPGSIFDSLENFNAVLENMKQESGARSLRLRQYMRAHPQKVANLSLGFSKALYMDSLNQLWMAELEKRNLPEDTARTAAQEQVFQSVADQIVEINKSFYSDTFTEFSDTLFVVAAGNDGDPNVPESGNNDLRPIWPANFSKTFKNVITIAAVDKNGFLTDFSDFGASSVNIAAPGKAIMSTAPGGLEVAMSGTSMASPYVAGLAARVRTLNPKLTAAQTRVLLEGTGRRNPTLTGKCTTGAAVDPDAAAQAAIASKDMDFDQAIEMSVKTRALFSGKVMILNNLGAELGGFKKKSDKTPSFVKDMMRSIFYR